MTALRNASPAAHRRRWPLLAIGASAGTATWSGWVGLGQLTGFGVVHPLPGIADGFTINTAVTLPIGVEAYAIYALSIATSARPLPAQTRRYAWASSAAALLLGMAGQVAYHVMTARHPLQAGTATELAPWQIVALVSCLPVLVLGAASLLWHLEGAANTPDVNRPVTEGPLRADSSATRSIHGSTRVTDPNPALGDGYLTAQDVPPDLRPPRPEDLARLREALTAGPVPGLPVAGISADSHLVGTARVTAHTPGTATAHSDPGNAVLPFAVVRRPHDSDGDPANAGNRRRQHRPRSARAADVVRLRRALADGVWPGLPTVREVRDHLGISSGHAVAARRILAAEQHPSTPAPGSPPPPLSNATQQPEQEAKDPAEESNSRITKDAST